MTGQVVARQSEPAVTSSD